MTLDPSWRGWPLLDQAGVPRREELVDQWRAAKRAHGELQRRLEALDPDPHAPSEGSRLAHEA